MLGPLAGLLLASRPATAREWAWIGAVFVWIGATLRLPGGIAAQMLHACALFLTGAFVCLMLVGRRVAPTNGALVASLIGFGVATLWAQILGTGWGAISMAVTHEGWEMVRGWLELIERLRRSEQLSAGLAAGLRNYMLAMGNGTATMARVYPATLLLVAFPALLLAWNWYHRIAGAPAGRPGGRFAEFRFSDHLVWGVVLSVTLFVLPLGGPAPAIASNLGLVMFGLYLARGAAVIWTLFTPQPGPALLAVGLGLLLLLPIAVGVLFALGLADTWIEFRHRMGAGDTGG